MSKTSFSCPNCGMELGNVLMDPAVDLASGKPVTCKCGCKIMLGPETVQKLERALKDVMRKRTININLKF